MITLDFHSMFIISQYFHYIEDFINIMNIKNDKGIKIYENLTDSYKYNPLPVLLPLRIGIDSYKQRKNKKLILSTQLFKNIQTLHIDYIVKIDVLHYLDSYYKNIIYWPSIYASDIIEFNNIKFMNVSYNINDIDEIIDKDKSENKLINQHEIMYKQSDPYYEQSIKQNLKIDFNKFNNSNKNITELSSYLFNRSSINECILSNSITYIGKCCFKCCNNLKEIYLPDSVKELGDYCFAYCGNLIKIRLSNNLKILPMSCFLCCNKLNEITLPKHLEFIKSLALGCDVKQINIYKSNKIKSNPWAFAKTSINNINEFNKKFINSNDDVDLSILYPYLKNILYYINEKIVETNGEKHKTIEYVKVIED